MNIGAVPSVSQALLQYLKYPAEYTGSIHFEHKAQPAQGPWVRRVVASSEIGLASPQARRVSVFLHVYYESMSVCTRVCNAAILCSVYMYECIYVFGYIYK